MSKKHKKFSGYNFTLALFIIMSLSVFLSVSMSQSSAQEKKEELAALVDDPSEIYNEASEDTKEAVELPEELAPEAEESASVESYSAVENTKEVVVQEPAKEMVTTVNEPVKETEMPAAVQTEAPAAVQAEKPAAQPEAPMVQSETPAQVTPVSSEGGALGADAASAEKSQEEAGAPSEETMAIEPGNVTVNFKGADIRTVLAYIAEVSGVDIVPSPDVKGIVDLKLTNKPWKVALDIILRNYGFAYEREGDIIRILTVDKLKMEELTSQAFSLNYSKAKDVVESIKNIVSERGKVMYDERTNTVVVTDIPTNIYKIGQIIDRLDKKTYQVLIEARVIETALDDTEKLGIDWNLKFSISGAARPTTLPFENFKSPFGPKQTFKEFLPMVQTGAPISVTTSGTSTTTTTTNLGDFPQYAGQFPETFPFATKDLFVFGSLDFTEFKAVLELLKSRSNTDIISNPRIATLNNTEALINVGQTLNMPKYERNSTTGKMEITGYDSMLLGVILTVTPHVNDNGEIAVDLEPKISDLLRYDTLDKSTGVVAPVFSQRQAKTKVMIKDGDTIFIGGLIKENNIDVKKKMPFLGDILGDVPYLGLLFTKKETTKQKTELIFFITVNLMSTGKEIPSAPVASKAYIPMYTATQEGDVAPKKRLKNKM